MENNTYSHANSYSEVIPGPL